MVVRLSCMSISIATRNMSREIPGTATVGPLFPYYSHRNPLKYGIWEGGPTMGVPEEILKHGKLMEIILIIITHARHVCRQSACVVQCSSLRYFQSPNLFLRSFAQGFATDLVETAGLFFAPYAFQVWALKIRLQHTRCGWFYLHSTPPKSTKL